MALVLADFSPSGAARLRVGLSTGSAEDLGELDWVSSLGARTVRHVFETPPDAWDDAFYRRAGLRGITVVPVIDTKRVPATAAARERFAELVRDHVRRYGPHGSFWDDNPVLPRVLAPTVFEVMNEPYVEPHGGPYDPGAYALLVRRTAQLVRGADDGARIAIALATTYFGAGADSGRPWLAALYRAVPDLNDWFDVGSVHPYAGDPDTCRPADRWCFRQLEVIRAMLVRRGASGKRILISEVGNNTGGADAVSEAEQADYLSRYVELADHSGYVEGLMYYNYADFCDDQADKECWFGVVRQDGTRKPAFAALHEAASAHR